MSAPLDDPALDALFRSARTRNSWQDKPLPQGALQQIYDLAKWGPTAANSTPARFVFCVSDAAKERLASASSGNNQPKIKAAPATVIIGYDLDFPEHLPRLFPHAPGMKNAFSDPQVTERTAMRNSSLQGAYLIVAARALGFDCGPMSGFDNAKVDELFFAGTQVKSNFICSIGYGDEAGMFERLPRLDFDEACKII
ncbi:MAG TPA: malonic semialdehyde reductase [Caulobacteraceae bacterium]|jgi:3-hydroxypropanoate dehydrogenase|nr:malonic semialdehyde reductase [Caulobacteraceae bacterium]